MFELIENAYRARPLDQFEWLQHAFGTRLFEAPGGVTILRQIHSDVIVYAGRPGRLGEGDALLSDTPGRLAGVRTADCVPILLADERHRAVAAVHAGWRGAVSRIAPKAVAAMSARWNTRPDDLHAAIGPGIGPCCFEVGPEVAAQFGKGSNRARVDLAEALEQQLKNAGVSPKRIYTANLCTFCRADQFHSFRRDREKAGRMISFIGIK